MKRKSQIISIETARLIIDYLYNNLSDSEKDNLDEWISHSDENMETFCILTKKVDDNVFDPNDLIMETEVVIDLWIIAGLIVRHQQGLNNKVEERYLNKWANADEKNKKLFKYLQHPAYMQKMLIWNELNRKDYNI